MRRKAGVPSLMRDVKRLDMSAPMVRPPGPADAAEWLRLRCQLWPDGTVEEHRADIAAFLDGKAREPAAVLVAEIDGRLIGFAELSIRACAEGCTTDRVAFLEGWYEAPPERRKGIGRALVLAAESWGRDQGCREFASDSQMSNTGSIGAPTALGFENAGVVVCFRKAL